jgi:hypothetical protein
VHRVEVSFCATRTDFTNHHNREKYSMMSAGLQIRLFGRGEGKKTALRGRVGDG